MYTSPNGLSGILWSSSVMSKKMASASSAICCGNVPTRTALHQKAIKPPRCPRLSVALTSLAVQPTCMAAPEAASTIAKSKGAWWDLVQRPCSLNWEGSLPFIRFLKRYFIHQWVLLGEEEHSM